jgi:hypothetical protein
MILPAPANWHTVPQTLDVCQLLAAPGLHPVNPVHLHLTNLDASQAHQRLPSVAQACSRPLAGAGGSVVKSQQASAVQLVAAQRARPVNSAAPAGHGGSWECRGCVALGTGFSWCCERWLGHRQACWH